MYDGTYGYMNMSTMVSEGNTQQQQQMHNTVERGPNQKQNKNN